MKKSLLLSVSVPLINHIGQRKFLLIMLRTLSRACLHITLFLNINSLYKYSLCLFSITCDPIPPNGIYIYIYIYMTTKIFQNSNSAFDQIDLNYLFTLQSDSCIKYLLLRIVLTEMDERCKIQRYFCVFEFSQDVVNREKEGSHVP